MKKFLKLLGLVAFLAILAALVIHFRGIPTYQNVVIDHKVNTSPEQIAKGKKMALTLCANCHLNHETGALTGKRMYDVPKEFGTIYSPNITQDKTYGIASYTDGELIHLLRTGIKKDGTYAPPYMVKLPNMADDDLDAIIAFLRSDDALVKANDTPDKPCKPSFLTKFLATVAFKPLPLPEHVIPKPDTSDKVVYGKYLAHNYDCYTCHSADFVTVDYLTPENSEGYFGGGNKPLTEKGEVIQTPNLTPDNETGIGRWSEERFVQAVKFGLMQNEPALRYPMLPYTHLTEYEISCIYAYLKTIPAISNKVVRSE